MSLAPIVMFVYNRADHFMQTFAALKECPEAKESELYIFSDGPKTEVQKEQVEEVRVALKEAKNKAFFREVKIIESPVNRGLAMSVIRGVTEVLDKHGKAIVVEDDCMPSPYFLNYMNQCLDFYEKNINIGAIAGYVPQLTFPKEFEDDVFVAYRSCSWGWATWKDRWQEVDWNLSKMQDFYRHPSLIKKLNSNGKDRFIRLYRQTKGNGSSWSVRFGADLVRKNQLTVYPRYSYIQNIGCDASGVHSKEEDAVKMQVDLSKAIAEPRLKALVVIPKIQRIMKRHYSGGIISDIKRTVATIVIVLKNRWKNG